MMISQATPAGIAYQADRRGERSRKLPWSKWVRMDPLRYDRIAATTEFQKAKAPTKQLDRGFFI